MKIEMFPLDAPTACVFLHLLAIDCKYSFTSLSNIVYPCLLHLEEDSGYEKDPNVVFKLKSLKHDP